MNTSTLQRPAACASDAGRLWKLHVFPRGRMCSLRRAMLLWLVPAFLLVALLSAGISYWNYTGMVAKFMDDQMEQLGTSIVSNKGAVLPMPSNEQRVHQWGDYVVQVYAADGTLQASSWPELQGRRQAASGFADLRFDGQRWRVFTAPTAADGRQVQVIQSGRFRTHVAFERVGAAIAPLLILLPFALAVMWLLSGAMSRAVRAIGDQAARQDEHSIEEIALDRVPVELQPMVVSFNALLTRLRDAFTHQRRLVQDAAHELRTPIAAVALQLENVCRDMPAGACAQSMQQLQAGVQRASRTVDQLLKLSRQEAAPAEAVALVDLQAQVKGSIEGLIVLADQRGIDIGLLDESTGPMPLRCPAGELRSVLDNLIENALRYTPRGGTVDVRLCSEAGRPVIEVIDSGPGIPADALERVFDRFFRVPGSTAGGSGLGLSIARAAAQRCGLRIALANRTDQQGLVARIELA